MTGEVPAVLRRWKQLVDEERGDPRPLPDVLRRWQAGRDAERELAPVQPRAEGVQR